MEQTIISPNMLKTFEACAIKYFYKYREQISVPVLDKGFQAGKNIHALASYYLNGKDITKFEKALTTQEADYWGWLKSNKYFNYEVVGSEKNISCRLSKFWIGGRIDAIVRDGGKYYILDYKTGGVNGDMTYDFQTMVYSLLCSEYYKEAESISFIYLDLKNKKEVITEFSDSLKLEYSDKLLKICTEIDEFDINKSVRKENCICEYSKICLQS